MWQGHVSHIDVTVITWGFGLGRRVLVRHAETGGRPGFRVLCEGGQFGGWPSELSCREMGRLL